MEVWWWRWEQLLLLQGRGGLRLQRPRRCILFRSDAAPGCGDSAHNFAVVVVVVFPTVDIWICSWGWEELMMEARLMLLLVVVMLVVHHTA
jgi:hypothetical protein